MIAQGGEVIVTISNDSWFGDSSAPYQHLAMAVFRSIENRRYLLRSTSNGISALVDPAGRIVYQSPLHEADDSWHHSNTWNTRPYSPAGAIFSPTLVFCLVLGRFASGWLIRKKDPALPALKIVEKVPA